ncbi:MAG: DUF3486 family protein, partial [Clostridiales bacterium]|nr:DUF3486 family protein [Clostridiales bacterium]
RVRDAKMFAKAIAEDNIDRPTTEIHEANNAIISQILMETIMSDETETAEKLKAASAIAQLQGAQVRNEKLKIDARKARSVFEIAIRELKEAVFEELGEHPQIADAVIRIADSKLSEVERAINV